MDDLLPFYEQELAFLRTYASGFAERFPKIASRLALTSETCDDPHVERMIQAFSLLTARIRKKLDDDYPEFTSALLGVLYPHYLRPFPSCAIVHIDSLAKKEEEKDKPLAEKNKKAEEISRIERGARLVSKGFDGSCIFRTCYDVWIAPIELMHAHFDATMHVPTAVRLPAGTGTKISFTLVSAGKDAVLSFAQLSMKKLRIYLDGESSFVAALRDALFLQRTALYVEFDDSRVWYQLPLNALEAVGFADEDALINYPARTHPAYRLLTEYFAFADKFNFVDLDLQLIAQFKENFTKLTIHVGLKNIRSESNQAYLLEPLSAKNLRLRCTPVVNLFKTAATPITVSHLSTHYTVTPAHKAAQACEVYSIDKVRLVRKRGETIEASTEFRPFYSLRHGEDKENKGRYWIARRDATLAQHKPGLETEISIVDDQFDPTSNTTDVLSIDLTCTNRDLPASLSVGIAGGDLYLEGNRESIIRIVRRPTRSLRFPEDQANHWRLISHLSLNHLSLVKTGLSALQEMLRLYDLARNPISQRQIAGVVGLTYKSTTAWVSGKPFATFVRGTEISLVIDEDSFIGTSFDCFVRVLQTFFKMYVHLNSFIDLVVISKKTGQEIMRCAQLAGLAHHI